MPPDAYTNFSVMVDRVASRFGRAEEASSRGSWGKAGRQTGREKTMGRELEKFRAVYHDSGRSTIFDIYTAPRPLREFELHSSGAVRSVLSTSRLPRKSDIAVGETRGEEAGLTIAETTQLDLCVFFFSADGALIIDR